MRNPWRFSFDRQTGDLFIGDVGQSSREEVNFQPASSGGGENYGWARLEGNLCINAVGACPDPVPACSDIAFTSPVIEYGHGGGGCSVIGGYVYRGDQVPQLQGDYLYGDFCTGALWAARRIGQIWETEELDLVLAELTSFGEDVNGEIYLTSADGVLARLVGTAVAGALELTRDRYQANESEDAVTVRAQRVGGANGSVSVNYATDGGSATGGADYTAVSGTLVWGDGDTAKKSFEVPLIDDLLIEPDETVTLTLSDPIGASLGSRSEAEVLIIDNDSPPEEECEPSETMLCLSQGRFRVEVTWEDFNDNTGSGQAIELTDDAGYFWFFDAANVELIVKVLDACSTAFESFWVFASGLTNVEVVLTVVDTESGVLRRYENPKGNPFAPIQDTNAFETCP